MIDEKKYIGILQAARIDRADRALNSGYGTPDATFHYGKECGINCGLRMAEELLMAMINDEREREKAAA